MSDTVSEASPGGKSSGEWKGQGGGHTGRGPRLPDSGSVSPPTQVRLAGQPPSSIPVSVGTRPGERVCAISSGAILDSKENGRIAPLLRHPLKSTREN